MTTVPADEGWRAEAAELVEGEGDAARAHLAAGRAVPYVDEDTPDGHVLRLRPDGSRELVRVGEQESVVGAVLPAV